MKLFNSLIAPCLGLSFLACSVAQAKPNDTFGIVENTTIKESSLTTQEKTMLVNAQKQVYETAQRIIENRYMDAWFKKYQAENHLSSLDAARELYFSKNASVTEEQVNKFLSENASNPELVRIPAEQRAPAIRNYLQKVSEGSASQKIIAEGYEKNQIKLVAFKKPEAVVVQIKPGGHKYSANLKNPKVTLIEFADYQCPFCVKANPEIAKFVADYKDKVQYIFMDFPLKDKHPQAMPSAIAANCAGKQGHYWEMHSLIFDRAPMDSLSPEKYTTFAKKLNLNMTEFEKCQADPAEIKKIDADLSEGIRVGIAGTPTLYINGRQFDENMTYENLKSNVDKILK